MSIATDSETTSVAARERWLHQELRRKERRGFGSYRTGEKRCAVVAASLLCSDLIAAFVALFTVDCIFGLSLTETALTGLPVLIGLFYVSGLYSGDSLPPGERLRPETPWHACFRRHVFRGLRRILPVKRLDRGRAPGDSGVSARLLRRSPDAPCPHSAQVVGCGDDLRRQRRSHRASPQLAVSNSGTWSATGRPRELRGGSRRHGSPGRRVRGHGNEARFRPHGECGQACRLSAACPPTSNPGLSLPALFLDLKPSASPSARISTHRTTG